MKTHKAALFKEPTVTAKGILLNRCILLILLSLSAVFVVYAEYISGRGIKSGFSGLPDSAGVWKKTQDITFKDKIIEILGTKDVFSGVYQNPAKQEVRVIVVFAVNNRSVFHPPEYCLAGAGWEIAEKRVSGLSLSRAPGNAFNANEMVFMTPEKEKLLVWNWYAAGASMTANFYRQQLKLLFNQLVSGNAGGAEINLYTNIRNNDIMTARQVSSDLAQSLIPFLNLNLQKIKGDS